MVPSVAVFTTCPSSRGASPAGYSAAVRDVGRWSERAGCVGTLVYADNGLVDPWLVAQLLMTVTERLIPLIAVQPVYMHPYAVAKLVASLALLHGRRVDLNMVAGGFRNDLEALADSTPHDRRYDRLREYTAIIAGLLRGGPPVTLAGEFYRVTRLTLIPELPPALFPTFFVSGSSEAGRAAARVLGATSVEYPAPAAAYQPAVASPEARTVRRTEPSMSTSRTRVMMTISDGLPARSHLLARHSEAHRRACRFSSTRRHSRTARTSHSRHASVHSTFSAIPRERLRTATSRPPARRSQSPAWR